MRRRREEAPTTSNNTAEYVRQLDRTVFVFICIEF